MQLAFNPIKEKTVTPRYKKVTSCAPLYFLLQGNTESAFSIYNEALKRAATEEKLHALPILYIHFSRLKYIVGIMCLSVIKKLTICFDCYYKYFDYDRNHSMFLSF